jgi:hypothetical protein
MKSLAVLGGWAVSIVLSIADLWLVQQAVVQTMVWLGTLRSTEERLRELVDGRSFGWTVETVSTTSLLILLCVAVGFEVWVEYFYRRGAAQGLLARRFLRVSLIQVIIAVAAALVTVILPTARVG